LFATPALLGLVGALAVSSLSATQLKSNTDNSRTQIIAITDDKSMFMDMSPDMFMNGSPTMVVATSPTMFMD
jgi:hypothetical protein